MLGESTDDHVFVNLTLTTDRHALLDGYVGGNLAILSDDGSSFDGRKRANFYARMHLGMRAD